MDAIAAFVAMGGYAAFVWPAYGVGLVVLGGLTLFSWRRYHQSSVVLDRLQQARRARR